MRQALLALATLLSHWRRHKINFAALVIGLALSTALWSGVQALNQQARQSYDQAAKLLGDSARSIVSPQGLFPQALYIKLRLAGWQVSPVLEGALRIGGSSLRLVGVEPLTLPRDGVARLGESRQFDGFLKSPGRAYAAPQTLVDLGVIEGASAVSDRGRALPPLYAREGVPPGTVLVDIGVAQTLLDRPKLLSRLLLVEPREADTPSLAAITQDALRLVEPREEPNLSRLTESFHLNLTAFGVLAFVVGLFIVHAACGLAFEQRLTMVRTMRAVGLSARSLTLALFIELVMLIIVAGGAGMLCGYALAAALLPNVATSLEGLYGAHVSGRLTLEPSWWAAGFGMTALGALTAAASGLVKTLRLPVLAPAQPFAWREAHRRYLRLQAGLAVCGFAIAAGSYVFGHGLASGFAVIAGALLGAALGLPLLLDIGLGLGEAATRGPVAHWFWADSRQQLPGLSLALMALLLALATNVGVGSMVEGFRRTFSVWLEERLTPEIYFEAATDADARQIEAWLAGRKEVTAVLPVWRAKTTLTDWPVDVIGLRAHETYRAHFPLLAAQEEVWDMVQRGEAVLVSEQLARKLGLAVGAVLDIPTEHGNWRAHVAGVYPDYGNPRGQLRIDSDALAERWPTAPRLNYSLRVNAEDAPQLIDALRAEFGAKLARVMDQAMVKELSSNVFERTFAVTAALNILTLIVAAIALMTSLLTLGAMRLSQLAPLWALGVQRRRLMALDLLRVLMLAGATGLIALPLGLFMAWSLVAIVNVEAFGWRLPFFFAPAHLLQIIAAALIAAIFSATIPLLRLARATPAELLKVFANER